MNRRQEQIDTLNTSFSNINTLVKKIILIVNCSLFDLNFFKNTEIADLKNTFHNQNTQIQQKNEEINDCLSQIVDLNVTILFLNYFYNQKYQMFDKK